ncbi:MAG: penicillin-binding transpeptidase domain-containing protein, partial [Chloroflexota bacterium]|nr:penicillin-binding transpeptidase domain-containing protein [Chloroflexota bacterium]
MTTARGMARSTTWLLLVATLASCAPPAVEPSPSASSSPPPALGVEAAEAAGQVARQFVADWGARWYEGMAELIAPADRDHYNPEAIIALLHRFDELAGVTSIVAETGTPIAASAPPDGGAQGPVPAFEVPIGLAIETDLFGRVVFRRMLVMTRGPDAWYARWRPSLLFPQLGERATLALRRTDAPRGRILAADGTLFAETRADGMRVYPQEWLAGQTIGYAAPLTAVELAAVPPSAAYQLGETFGRSGLEQGAEALLRGSPGLVIEAITPDGDPVPILERPLVPGADLTITIRPSLQATAEAALASSSDAATVVLDPRTGDVWALASAPRFNPNSMTLGTTLAGQRLAVASASARLNRAVLTAQPTGSSFKPFALLAALETGVATPATRMSCLPTWRYGGFTYHNYLDHTLGSSVSLVQAMAFSCNTTYMPLAIRVWDADPAALTDIVADFGFGQSTEITHLADAPGTLPDAHYFDITPRSNGRLSPYGPTDQIQLAIGQGSFQGTPLQLANAYAAFANGGTLWVPRLVTRATLPDGKVVEQYQPRPLRQVDIRPETFEYLRQALRAVVSLPTGTAYAAFAGFGHQVAGKSGTAETGTPNPHAWFPAFAPVDAGEVVVVTVLLRVTIGTGGSRTAPLVRRVMARYF